MNDDRLRNLMQELEDFNSYLESNQLDVTDDDQWAEFEKRQHEAYMVAEEIRGLLDEEIRVAEAAMKEEQNVKNQNIE